MITNDFLLTHAIASEASIREAMRQINKLSGESMTLFVMSPSEEILGSVTDGDIRRFLMYSGELNDSVSKAMNSNFLAAKSPTEISEKMAAGRERNLELLPVLENGRLVDLLDLKAIRACLPVEAVMMAGGRGERLRPLTDEVPKPLLPVAGKAIIDYNVEELEACGIKKIYVTVNYLGNLIKVHFQKRAGRAEVKCVEEPKRLGTFGSLALVEGIGSDDVIVMNSDLLTAIDYEALYLHHKKNKSDFTIAAVPYSVSVPFAIIKMQGNRVKSLEEKPTYNYFANGGVYILKSSLISRIRKGEYLDAPDFIMGLIKDKMNVGCFHIDGTWVDIGSPDDYRLANELASRGV